MFAPRVADAAPAEPSFSGGLLHAATVLCAPVAVVALLLLYCASGDVKWKTPTSSTLESAPLFARNTAQASALRLSGDEESGAPGSVFLKVKPGSWAVRSSGL
jgi:hypothetical protein